jgi:transketolase
MVHNAKSGHLGGSLSSVELLVVLFEIMKHNPINPKWQERDRFVLSKGHASPVFYSVLAEYGYIPQEELMTFRKLGSRLQGHPSNLYLDCVEVPTGSLGQGLSMACGIALSLKLDENPANVYCLMGDGELQEGSCWEAFMNADTHKLNNLIAIIDRNRLQIDGNTENIKCLDNLKRKIEGFNWNVIEVDGHNCTQIISAYTQAKNSTKPTAIIANTIKGKGISFMENNAGWHGKAPNDEELALALKEVEV